MGQFVKQRTRIGYRGRNPDKSTDQQVAEALSDLFLYIKQNTNLEFEERETFEDGTTSGFGVLEAYVSFDALFNPEIKIRHVDSMEVYPDPNSRRYDWNEDAAFIDRAKWVHYADAVALWPEYKDEITGNINNVSIGVGSDTETIKGNTYTDPVLKRIRVVESWYKAKERKSVVIFSNGETLESTKLTKKELAKAKEGKNYREIEKIVHKMYCGTFTSGLLLDHKEVDRINYPFIPYFVQRKKNGCPYSSIFIALPLQDAINKRESKALHLLSSNKMVYERGAVKDKVAAAVEVARPDGQVELEPGSLSQGKFMIDKNTEMGMQQFSMHSDAKISLRQVTGVNPEALGEPSEVRSGVGIARKVAMTDVITAPVFDNFRRTRLILARTVLELIQKNYTQKLIFSITDDLGAVKTVALNDPTAPMHLDIKQGLFDAVVDDLPDVTTVHQEQFQTLAQALPQILPFGPFWTKIFLQASDLRNKDEIIKQLEQQQGPPPAEPKISVALQWTEMQPQEKAAFAQKMGMPELAQFEQSSGAEPAHIVKAKADLMKEAGKSQAEGQRAQADLQISQQEMANNQQKHQLEMHHEQQKHQLDVEKAKIDIAKTVIGAQAKAQNGGASKNG